MSPRTSLTEYAEKTAAATTGKPAWIVTIPEFDEIVAAYKAGVSVSTILGWLTAPPPDGCGYPPHVATRNKVGRYLTDKVKR